MVGSANFTQAELNMIYIYMHEFTDHGCNTIYDVHGCSMRFSQHPALNGVLIRTQKECIVY